MLIIYKSYENVWKCMKMHENVWKCMKMYENVWKCMKMYDITVEVGESSYNRSN